MASSGQTHAAFDAEMRVQYREAMVASKEPDIAPARAHDVGTSESAELPSDFDAEAYLVLHRDVAAAGVDAATHYLTFGKKEGRSYRRSDLRDCYDADGLRSIHNHDFMTSPGVRQPRFS